MRRAVRLMAALALVVPAIVLATPASAAPTGAATSPSVSPGPVTLGAACGTTVSDRDGSSWPPATTAVNLRSGSSTGCAILAAAQVGDRLDYHCYTVNDSSGYTWTYLRDNRTGARGWARDDNLPGHGSWVYCGF